MSDGYHQFLFVKVPESRDNAYAQAEVAGGGGDPIWHPSRWWTGAEVTVHSAARDKVYLHFFFPEGTLVDALGHGLANLIDGWMARRRKPTVPAEAEVS